MLRAKETAAIIAPALRAPLLLDENVREWHPGEAEGMHQDEIQEKYGKDNPSLWSNPFQPLAPGGENWGQFVLRVGTALDRITRQYEGKTVVIVCHGGIIEISFLYFSGIAMLDLPPVHYYNSPSSITYWRKVPFDGWPAGWNLVKHNDDMHLLGLTLNEPLLEEKLSGKPNEQAEQSSSPLERA